MTSTATICASRAEGESRSNDRQPMRSKKKMIMMMMMMNVANSMFVCMYIGVLKKWMAAVKFGHICSFNVLNQIWRSLVK